MPPMRTMRSLGTLMVLLGAGQAHAGWKKI